jgi:nucleoid-associated protein YgaU
MISLADNIIPPPPPPPSTVIAQGQQPPPPAGYVQPPGYQDGVPFGGQIGAVPGSSASRSSTARTSTTRLVASVYVVRAGDTLSSIALRVYGDARRAPSIWEANYRLIGADPNRIFPGQRLTMPGLTTRAVVRPAELLPIRGSIAQQANYTIQPRDFLRWMAERAYGNEVFWPEIFRANRNVLGPNPDLIYPGVTVYIP